MIILCTFIYKMYFVDRCDHHYSQVFLFPKIFKWNLKENLLKMSISAFSIEKRIDQIIDIGVCVCVWCVCVNGRWDKKFWESNLKWGQGQFSRMSSTIWKYKSVCQCMCERDRDCVCANVCLVITAVFYS